MTLPSIGKARGIDCNIELLRAVRADGAKTAIATGSSKPSVLPVLKLYDIVTDALVTAEDVQRGKPDPELFLKAAERLNAQPDTCIVVEDSDVGIEAAAAAGMRSLRFTMSKTHNSNRERPAE